MKTRRPIVYATVTLMTTVAFGEPKTYDIDPTHTYASVEAPHIQGISHWRGKFNRTISGSATFDPQANAGRIEVVIDATSLDFGHAQLNEDVRGAEFLDSARYPTATFRSNIIKYKGAVPVETTGTLTLHGVTRPITLKIDHYGCIPDPFVKIERCGADVYGVIDRTAFGIDKFAQMTGTEVNLAIQVEGLVKH